MLTRPPAAACTAFVSAPLGFGERAAPVNLKLAGTHTASSALLSLFNFRRRTFATAQSCCLQRARPLAVPLASLKDGATCSGSARLPGSSVLLLCSQTPVPTKDEISRLQRAAVLSPVRLCDPVDCGTPRSPVPHCLPEFAQTHIH